jgi:PPM family protein phosphatase
MDGVWRGPTHGILSHLLMLELEFAELSHPGCVRRNNEDFAGHVVPESLEQARSHGWLFAVADGVGGQDLGEVASRTAVESVLDDFQRAGPQEPHSGVLLRIVKAANTRVYETGRAASPGGVAMATTIVVCALRFDRAVIAHVGDSRCYLIRGGLAATLTRDHTVVNEQVRLGILSAGEAAQAEARHILSRSLGNDLFVNVDFDEHQVIPGDVLLLCSDGLYGPVPAADIANIVKPGAELPVAAERLVELANNRGGDDNVTVQLIRIRNVERIGMYRGRPYRLR